MAGAKGLEGKGRPSHSQIRKAPPDALVEAAMRDARKLVPNAIKTLGLLLDSDSLDIKLRAAQEILNRALGKPHQNIQAEVEHTHNIHHSHLKAIQDFNNKARGVVEEVAMIDITPQIIDAAIADSVNEEEESEEDREERTRREVWGD